MVARKTSGVPTRIFRYGLPFGPTSNEELVLEHMTLAHKLYNDLIEVERSRITKYREIVSLDPVVQELEAQKAELDENISLLSKKQKESNSAARKKGSSPDLASQTKRLKSERAALKDKLQEARKHSREISTPQLDALGEEVSSSYKKARNSSGLHDGTYNFICASAQQAGKTSQKEGNLPRFRRWMEGPGSRASLGQQIKSSDSRLWASTPQSPSDRCVFDGKDTRVQLSVPNSRGHAVLRLRFASGEKRVPIWAEFPIVLHRPLPPDAEIKQVRVMRTRIGPYRGAKHTRWRWEALFFIESHMFGVSRPTTGQTAAIDVGWACAEEGGLRVGYLVGSDGAQSEIRLPESLKQRFDIADSLQAIRKKEFNEFSAELITGLKENPSNALHSLLSLKKRDGSTLSAVPRIEALKSPSSLSKLVWLWSKDRQEGDDFLWAKADSWRQKNDHLHQWEAGARTKAVLARKEWYRVLASRLAKRYDRVFFEDLDLQTLAKSKVGGSNRTVASTSDFRESLELLTGRHRVPAAGTSRTCSACGGRCEWDVKTYKKPACTSCGTVWDRDANAGANILAASGAVVSKTLEPLDLVELQALPCPKAVVIGPLRQALNEVQADRSQTSV